MKLGSRTVEELWNDWGDPLRRGLTWNHSGYLSTEQKSSGSVAPTAQRREMESDFVLMVSEEKFSVSLKELGLGMRKAGF